MEPTTSNGAPTETPPDGLSRPSTIASTAPILHTQPEIIELEPMPDKSAALGEGGPAPDVQTFEPPPEGGYGWVIVFVCFVGLFFSVGICYSWGVIEARLVADNLAPASTISFIGSLCASCVAFFGIINSNIVKWIGAKYTFAIGIACLGLGILLSGWTTHTVVGLFMTAGLLQGLGVALVFMPCSILPPQYFVRKRGLATGIVFSAGGLGGAVITMMEEVLLRRFGPPWTFRILGIATLAIGLPASLAIKERGPARTGKIIEFRLFKDPKFATLFFSAAVGVFPLFVAPFFLPLYGATLGLSTWASAGLVAGFNFASAVGRLVFGHVADIIGPVNTLMLTEAANALSLLIIWPLSDSVSPLVVFVVVNGLASGAFFSLMPTCVASLVDPAMLRSAMGMTVSGWAGGYLVGAPIAGYLLQASGGADAGLAPYRPAMFYAGALTLLSGAMLLVMKMMTTKSLRHRM